ncbi:hypothetical protein V6Z12_D04G044200 [Gossypium hirsutum]
MRKRYIAVGVYCQRKSRYSYSKKSSYLPDLRKLIKRRKMGLKQTIRSLDAFPRTEEHLLQKTQSGALVASIDAIDLSGKHEVDLDTNIWKLRLNSHGHIIGTKYLSDLVEKQHTTRNHDDKEHHDGSAKKPHKFSFDKDAENMINKVKKALENGEGCRVYGVLDVQRVAGNFHISVHALNIYVAQMIFGGAKHVNVSHMIHDLSFGPKYPGLHNPLDDTVRILHDTSGTFKYYIKGACR